MLYAKTCKICNHVFYMQNMQKYALPTLLMIALFNLVGPGDWTCLGPWPGAAAWLRTPRAAQVLRPGSVRVTIPSQSVTLFTGAPARAPALKPIPMSTGPIPKALDRAQFKPTSKLIIPLTHFKFKFKLY